MRHAKHTVSAGKRTTLLLPPILAITAWAATSAQAQSNVPDKPARPTADSVSHDSVTFSWTDPSDSSIIEYQVLRRNRDTDAKGDFTVIENDTSDAGTSYTDHTVDASTTYGYRMKARSSGGLSPRSNSLRVKTPAAPAESPTPAISRAFFFFDHAVNGGGMNLPMNLSGF